jgi:D-sedoheptulose 7-phosphate isomerase
MKKSLDNCFYDLKVVLDGIIVTDSTGEYLPPSEGLQSVVSHIASVRNRKLMLIGNGASAAIASHIATDFWKNAGVPAFVFNDSSLLTAIGNDLGYRHVFEKPIQFFGQPDDILIAISSSGQSENILRAVSAAQALGIYIITLSGFKQENPLREMGHFNFYVPSMTYGLVEVAHHAICHFVVNKLSTQKCSDMKESHLADIVPKSTVREILPPHKHQTSTDVVDISD